MPNFCFFVSESSIFRWKKWIYIHSMSEIVYNVYIYRYHKNSFIISKTFTSSSINLAVLYNYWKYIDFVIKVIEIPIRHVTWKNWKYLFLNTTITNNVEAYYFRFSFAFHWVTFLRKYNQQNHQFYAWNYVFLCYLHFRLFSGPQIVISCTHQDREKARPNCKDYCIEIFFTFNFMFF